MWWAQKPWQHLYQSSLQKLKAPENEVRGMALNWQTVAIVFLKYNVLYSGVPLG